MSRYAILQTSLEVPEAEAVRRAFKRISFLTPADASIVLRDAFGVLFRNLSHEDANAVLGALASEGIVAEAVEHSHLPELPPTKFVKRIELRPDELIIYDPLGRKFGLEWGHVALVSAGLVPVEEEQAPASNSFGTELFPGLGYDLATDWGSGSAWIQDDGYGSMTNSASAFTPRKRITIEKRFLDVVLTRGVTRYTLEAEETLLSHALGRPCGRELPNAFVELIQKFCAHCPGAC